MQAFRGKTSELGRFLEIDLSGREGFNHVGREFEDGQVLSYEAVDGDTARCFTLENAPKLAGRLRQLFARPMARAAPFGVR